MRKSALPIRVPGEKEKRRWVRWSEREKERDGVRREGTSEKGKIMALHCQGGR